MAPFVIHKRGNVNGHVYGASELTPADIEDKRDDDLTLRMMGGALRIEPPRWGLWIISMLWSEISLKKLEVV